MYGNLIYRYILEQQQCNNNVTITKTTNINTSRLGEKRIIGVLKYSRCGTPFEKCPLGWQRSEQPFRNGKEGIRKARTCVPNIRYESHLFQISIKFKI